MKIFLCLDLNFQFYSTLAKVYSSLGNNKKAIEFENKIKTPSGEPDVGSGNFTVKK